MRGTQLQLSYGIKHWRRIKFGQLIHFYLSYKAMCLHQVSNGLVNHIIAVHIGTDIALPVELTNHRDHTFGKGFSLFPIFEKIIR